MTLDTSIILKGLTPLVKPSVNWLGSKIIGEEILERRQLQATALQPVLQQAADKVSEIIKPIGEAEIDQICLFLTSNEAEAVVRQIYAVSILESKEQNLQQIKQEFLKAFSLYTGIPEDELRDSAPEIFDTLVDGCEETLRIAIDEGRLSAHEAKSVFRHQMLLDEIANIRKNLELLSRWQQLDLKAILEFEKRYRQQVKDLHGKLTPPYISDEKKLPINNLYVCPDFSQETINRDTKKQTNKNQSQFYKSIYRTVLLGNPGGGKSTCGQKFCYDLVTQYSERLLNGRQVTPILVILRDYGVKKKEINCSLLEFIELTAKTKYQLQPPPGALEYLLLNNRLAIVFDGLDELTETSYRQEIRNDVELFCNLYPSLPVLVTSREVGYKEAPLDESKFEVYRLAPFNDEQVKEYVTKWFAIDRDLTKEQQQEKIKAFLAESKNLTDLRSNPLMLGLMCNIYKGEGYIPRNRPDVYQKCADMLFDRINRTPDKLFGILLPRIVKQEWNVVCQLVFQLQNTKFEDAGDELLNYLIEEINSSPVEQQKNMLLFAVQCLEFIVPSPKTVTNIVFDILDLFVEFGKVQIENSNQNEIYSNPEQIFSDIIDSLHKSNNENHRVITSTIELYINRKIPDFDNYQLSAFLEFFYDLKLPIISKTDKESFLAGYESKIKEVAKNDLFICILYRDQYDITLQDIRKWHGIDSFFYNCSCRIRYGTSYIGIALDIFWNFCYEVPGNNNLSAINEASQLGNLLIESKLPIVDASQSRFSIFASFDRDNANFIFENLTVYEDGDETFSKLIADNYDALFGGCIIFAVYLEAAQDYLILDDDDWLYHEIKYAKIPFFQFICYIFIARFRELGKYDREIKAELNKCKFNQEQRDFIWKWVRREIDLVAIAESEQYY